MSGRPGIPDGWFAVAWSADLPEGGVEPLRVLGRELVLYWRDLGPREVREVTIDLVGRIPGETTGPASRAYLYYTPDSKSWAAPLAIEVLASRPR